MLVYKSIYSKLVVTKEVFKLWQGFRQLKPSDLEACGVLIGEYCKDSREYHLDYVTAPMGGDLRQRSKFRMLDKSHQNTVDTEWNKSDGTRFYLGYWHSHPENDPIPSPLDRKEWIKNFELNIKHLPSLFFPIIGKRSIEIWEFNSKKISKMELLNEDS